MKQPTNPFPAVFEPEKCDALFALIRERMLKVLHNPHKPFWRELRRIDAELSPACIVLEKFSLDEQIVDAHSGEISHLFSVDEPTVVMRLKSKETACDGADILNELFQGCGTRFVAEKAQNPAGDSYQIRTNLDKRHWDKLCVLCACCFHHEVPAVNQGDEVVKTQGELDAYLQGTGIKDWQSVDGVPVFATIMGTPGILRSHELEKPNVKRKRAEVNGVHERGTPSLFEGIVVHVDLRKDGSVACVPYTLGFYPTRQALRDAFDHKPAWWLALETVGGNPFETGKSWRDRAINSIGLVLGTTGLLAAGHQLVELAGPAGTTAAGIIAAGAATADKRWGLINKVQKAHDTWRQHRRERHQQQEVDPQPQPVLAGVVIDREDEPLHVLTPDVDVDAALLRHAYTHAHDQLKDGTAHEIDTLPERLARNRVLHRLIQGERSDPGTVDIEAKIARMR